MDERPILNKKIKTTSYDSKYLTFKLEDSKEIKYYAEGDCCSSSFIEDIDDLEVLQNCTITEVDSVSGHQIDKNDYEVHKWTFVKFTTDKGRATLSFRNESNGYYNGYLELME